MVVATLDIALVAFPMRFGIDRVLGQCFVTVSHSVRLYIRFGYHVDAILVAEVIPTVVVRIVTGTYGIDIKLFHHFDVLQHTLDGNYITAVRIHFVTVGSLEEYRLSVDEYLSAFQFNFAETYFNGDYFYCIVTVFQCSGQCIKIRCFSRPFSRIGNVQSGV